MSGEKIPLCGRIVALADVYDALTSRRCYKDPMPHDQAKQLILHESGKHFDPAIVNAFLIAENEFLRIYDRFANDEIEQEDLNLLELVAL